MSPSRRRFLLASLGCGATALAAWQLRERGWQRVERTSHALGTKVKITALHADEQHAAYAIAVAFAELHAIEARLSIYRADSELSRLNRAGRLDGPSRSLLEVLRYARETSAATGGAFDVTVQPLYEVHDAARRAGTIPSDEQVAAARGQVDWRQVHIAELSIRLAGRGTKITLNGIAQGYAADQTLAVLRENGIEHALIDTGELFGLSVDEQPAWRVGIQHPRHDDAYVALAELDNRALSTSGDYATTFTADRRHHHLLDPATGRSPSELASVSIAAPTAMEADALSTACFVLGSERAAELIASRAGVDALMVTKTGHVLTTPGFPVGRDEEGGPAV